MGISRTLAIFTTISDLPRLPTDRTGTHCHRLTHPTCTFRGAPAMPLPGGIFVLDYSCLTALCQTVARTYSQ